MLKSMDWLRKSSCERVVAAVFLVAVELVVVQQIGAQSREKSATRNMLDEALEAVRNENFPKAEAILTRIIVVEPNNADARTLAGIVAERKDDLPTAQKHFAAAARLKPGSPETRNNYGAILLRQKRTSEAITQFKASLKLNPTQTSAQVNLGRIYFEKGTPEDLRTARGLLENIVRSKPEPDLARVLVLIDLRLGEYERASLDFQNYSSIAGSDTQSAADRTELGLALLKGNLTLEAGKELEAALSLEPGNVQILVALSHAYLATGDIKNAGKTLESALARGLEDARIYAALADVYQAGGFIENAIPALQMAIDKDPDNEIFRARYGLLLIDSMAPAAAVIRLNEYLKRFPRSARIWLALGMAQLADGKTGEAGISFEKSLELDPRSVPALAYLATVQVEQADFAKGVETYRRALTVDDQNAYLHFLVAETLAKIPTSSAAEIEKHLKRSVELDATLAGAHLALGKLEARAARWESAAAEFKQAIKHEPQLAEAYYQLGRTLTRLKRGDEAKAAFDKHKQLAETQSTKKETDRREYVRRLANVRF